MTNKEREEKLKAEHERHNKAMYDIDVEFATSNNYVLPGDILSDGYSIILVDKIHMNRSYSIPTCVYTGVRLKKNLKPRVDGTRASIWQGRIKMHLRDGKAVEIDGIKE